VGPTDAPARDAGGDRPTRSRLRWVWLVSAVIAAMAVAAWIAIDPGSEPLADGARFHWLILAAGFALTEAAVIHIQLRRESYSFSLSEAPLILGLLFVGPSGLLMAQLLGVGVALVAHRRQPLIKVVFNLSHLALETCLAIVVYEALLGGGDPLDPQSWTAAFAATAVGAVVNVMLITVAISIIEGAPRVDGAVPVTLAGLIMAATNTGLALVIGIVIGAEPLGILLLVPPTAALIGAYRAYSTERRRRDGVEFLYRSTSTLQGSPEVDEAVVSLLEMSCETFTADAAELFLLPTGGTSIGYLSSVRTGEARRPLTPVDCPPTSLLWDAAREATVPKLIEPDGTVTPLRRYLDERGLGDAIVAALPGPAGPSGLLIVAERRGDVHRFTTDDLRLLGALATSAAVALENEQLEQSLAQLTELEEELSHQAFHDSLTGLANRARFLDRVEQAVAAAVSPKSPIAVVFVDLDDFKTVNDSLGHEAGDRLLVVVAERLSQALEQDGLAARLGGDEFAALVDGPVQPDELAARLLTAFERPVELLGGNVQVAASVGVATWTGTESPEELLRNADVAMYAAKARGKNCFEIFTPNMYEVVVERHELAAKLRRGVQQREFVTHYQPIVDLADNRIVGMEALVRWNHPERGLLAPDVFLPLAEEKGHILPIGRQVLDEAVSHIQEVDRLLPSALPFITVNLSALQLVDPELIGCVRDVLVGTGLDPSRLVVEITETAVMDDPVATRQQLVLLQEMGLRLALDDFGTGYSSLSHLRSFPIDYLKIAKPFVDGLLRGREELALFRAIIHLGQVLGLTVIAEGVESVAQVVELRRLGCDQAQGFYFSRPVPAAEMVALLRQSADAEVPSG
jgi:diguanylate cyclase (GGDEF)-like protein